jgi:poly-gamma-glutamate synthesis protein (capsule biosynthesis protein)
MPPLPTVMLFPLLFLALLVSASGPPPLQDQSPDSTDVVLRFGGDLLLAGYYEESMGGGQPQGLDGFPGLAGADVAMVNLECPITARGEKTPKPYNFRMTPRYVPALTAAGIDIVCLANNHIYDYGKEGLFDTISYLDSAGVRHVGAGRDAAEAYRPVMFNVRGTTVAFLAFYGGGESPGAGRSTPGVARRDLRLVSEAIARIHDSTGNARIIVNLHWGTEKAEHPDASQRAFARAVIDAGADAVIGHHPHVLQGIERYNSGVIVYSLGNLVFGGNSRSSYDTGLFEIRFGRHAPAYAFIPLRVDEWRPSLLRGADSAAVMEKVRRLSSGFARSIFNNEENR